MTRKTIKIIQRIFEFISELGNSGLGEEEQRINRFHNRGMLAAALGIVSTLAFTSAFAAYVIYYSFLKPAELTLYAQLYFGIQGGFLVFTFLIIYLKNKLKSNLLLYWFYIPLHLIYIYTFSAMLGSSAGFFYFCLVFIIIPVYAPVNSARHKTAIFFLYLAIIITGGIFFFDHPGIYPLPVALSNISYISIAIVVFLYLVINSAFLWWHLQLTPKAAAYIRKLINYQIDHVSIEEQSAHRLSNQGFLLILVLGIFYLGFTIALSIWAALIDTKYIAYLLIFTMPILMLLGLILLMYRTPKRIGNNLKFEMIVSFCILTTVLYYELLFGAESNIYWLFLTFLPLPIYFNGISTRGRILVAVIVVAIVASLIALLPGVSSIIALPAAVLNFMARGISSLLIISATAALVFITIRFHIISKLISYWRRLTQRGDSLFESELERKYRRIASGMTAFALQLSIGIAISEIALYIHFTYFTQDQVFGQTALLYYLPPTLATIPVYLGTLYFQGRTRSYLPAFISLLVGLAFTTFLGISHEMNTLIFLTPLFALPIPFMGFPLTEKRARPIIFIMVCLYIASVFGSNWFLENYGSLQPLPGVYTIPIRYLVVTFFIACAVGSTLIAFRNASMAEENLELEKKKSEALLLNILPTDVAEELKDKGFTLPVSHDSVSVLFTDFVGFTQSSRMMEPQMLVRELDNCFSYFDNLMEKHRLEKLKTIGDAYMCAGGIPIANKTHAIDCCLVALRIKDFMAQRARRRKVKKQPHWQVRIGLHTGPLVAGVVGAKKFAYDVWGDTVNIASRLESTGKPGEINISRDTYERVEPYFICRYRGKLPVKGGGKIDMYFVKRIKPKYAQDRKGIVPNKLFWEAFMAY